MQKLKKNYIFLLSAYVGIGASMIISHPDSKINKRIPVKKIRKVQLLPHLRIEARERLFHIHHWVHLIVPLMVLHLLGEKIPAAKEAKGFLLGCILHGLTFGDRFNFAFS